MRGATLSTWRGYPMWTCALCPDTRTNRAAMVAHLRRHHRISKPDLDVPDLSEDQEVALAATFDETGGQPPPGGGGGEGENQESQEPSTEGGGEEPEAPRARGRRSPAGTEE